MHVLKLKTGSNIGSDTLTRDPTRPDQNRWPCDPETWFHRLWSILLELDTCVQFVINVNDKEYIQWPVAYTYKVRMHPLSGKYVNFLYLIYELFRSLWKTCLCSIVKLVPATRCQILRLKCIKFNFHWGSVPDPLGELRPTALPQTP